VRGVGNFIRPLAPGLRYAARRRLRTAPYVTALSLARRARRPHAAPPARGPIPRSGGSGSGSRASAGCGRRGEWRHVTVAGRVGPECGGAGRHMEPEIAGIPWMATAGGGAMCS
jgi:hypothetical protein